MFAILEYLILSEGDAKEERLRHIREEFNIDEYINFVNIIISLKELDKDLIQAVFNRVNNS